MQFNSTNANNTSEIAYEILLSCNLTQIQSFKTNINRTTFNPIQDRILNNSRPLRIVSALDAGYISVRSYRYSAHIGRQVEFYRVVAQISSRKTIIFVRAVQSDS